MMIDRDHFRNWKCYFNDIISSSNDIYVSYSTLLAHLLMDVLFWNRRRLPWIRANWRMLLPMEQR